MNACMSERASPMQRLHGRVFMWESCASDRKGAQGRASSHWEPKIIFNLSLNYSDFIYGGVSVFMFCLGVAAGSQDRACRLSYWLLP